MPDSFPRPIVLVGLMGAGKTTIGAALAEAIGYRFVDNDAGIEAEYEATGAELAERLGVEELHRIEAQQLARAIDSFDSEPVVIAAAASVVEDPAGLALLRDRTTVWLDAPPAYLAGRLSGGPHRRKLGLDPALALADQHEARRDAFLAAADMVVAVAGRSTADIVDEIHIRLLGLPAMYAELADWFHLITSPSDYREEAGFYWEVMASTARRPLRKVLELGSGGGNNAYHLKAHADLTLVDLSPAMVRQSRTINPECEHLIGDMRTLWLGRRFDAVFIHDAIGYLTTEEDLRLTAANAAAHLEPGGVVLLVPDHVAETFVPGMSTGGGEDERRSIRYEERWWDPDPADTTYLADYTYRLSEGEAGERVVEDRHELGLFSRSVWLQVLEAAGLEATMVPFDHSEVEDTIEAFTGVAPR